MLKQKRQGSDKILRSAKENFDRASAKATTGMNMYSTWPVFEEYKVERIDGELFVSAVVQPLPKYLHEDLRADLSAKFFYAPLYDYPDLFVRFARLPAAKGSQTEEEILETALDWIHSYGILGVEGIDPTAYRGKGRGGRRECVSAFAAEAKRAAFVLDAFEAIVADDPQAMRDCFERYLLASVPKWSLDNMRGTLIGNVERKVSDYIERDCYPSLNKVLTSNTPEYSFSQGWEQRWEFRSLLGAMYLQMMFYALEPGMLRYCKAEDCDNIVTFEAGAFAKSSRRGARGEYRTRTDKVYCTKACAERMRYQSKKKQPS